MHGQDGYMGPIPHLDHHDGLTDQTQSQSSVSDRISKRVNIISLVRLWAFGSSYDYDSLE